MVGYGRLAALGLVLIVAAAASPSFVIENDRFVRDGEPFTVMSGELHYARIPRAYWRDRLQRLRAMGMNAVISREHGR